jgi:hypothetical protein
LTSRCTLGEEKPQVRGKSKKPAFFQAKTCCIANSMYQIVVVTQHQSDKVPDAAGLPAYKNSTPASYMHFCAKLEGIVVEREVELSSASLRQLCHKKLVRDLTQTKLPVKTALPCGLCFIAKAFGILSQFYTDPKAKGLLFRFPSLWWCTKKGFCHSVLRQKQEIQELI